MAARERVLAGARDLETVADSSQRTRDQLAIAIIVFDDQNGSRAGTNRAASRYAKRTAAPGTAAASTAWNVLPTFGVDRTPTEPPCASTSRRVSASPRPGALVTLRRALLELLELDEQPAEIRGRDADAGVLDLEPERLRRVREARARSRGLARA